MKNKTKLVQGVGANDYEGSVVINGKHIKSYQAWYSMLTRCYDPKAHEHSPTYIGCTVSKEWLSFATFKAWFDINYREGYQLDKDLLNKDNKTYSAENCVFVPQEINKLLLKRDASRGKFPIGVYFHKRDNKFVAAVRINGILKHLGLFDTAEEAYNAYKTAKEMQVATIATEYYHAGKISLNVYNALIDYKVEIAD